MRDFLHVDDLASAVKAFYDSIINYGTYNVGGGRENAITIRELVARVELASGLQAVIDEDRPLPAPAPQRYVSDLSLVSQELDWLPKIGLNEGLNSLFA